MKAPRALVKKKYGGGWELENQFTRAGLEIFLQATLRLGQKKYRER
jgi:hypothetical protein